MLRQLITDLAGQRSYTNTTSLVTMYVPGTEKVPDVMKMVSSEMSKSTNIKSRQTRQNVQDSLQAISSQLKIINKFPENGVAFFAGSTEEKFVNTVIDPPSPINNFFYRCDT